MTRALSFVFLLSFIAGASFAATPPEVVNFEGVLRDQNGNPLSGTYGMIFRFMDAATLGNEISSTQHINANAVTVSGGLFNVALGTTGMFDGTGPGLYVSLADVFRDHTGVWLEIQVGAETLSPRVRFLSSPYALNARSAVNATQATNATNATNLGGQPASSYLHTGSGAQTRNGPLTISTAGPTTCAILDGPIPLSCQGQAHGAYLSNSNNFSYAYVPDGPAGILAWGSNQGGVFNNFNSSAFANIGASTYKIWGNGAVSFVQNHPDLPEKVIVYAAPEGDEVAVYTRGSGRLVKGEARVALGETFSLVANPDIGLTATVTPIGEPIALAVVDKNTRELVVRGPRGSNASFDYAVWGLRIGFEEQSIVQPKQRDARIPSMVEHEGFFTAEPELRDFTALERFKGQEVRVAGQRSFVFSQAAQLRDRIGVFPPGSQSAVPGGPQGAIASHHAGPAGEGLVDGSGPVPEAAEQSVPLRSHSSTAESRAVTLDLEPSDVMMAGGVMEPGDVVSLDPEWPGAVLRSGGAGDPLVIGCARDAGAVQVPVGQVAIGTHHVTLCRVDAGFGAVRVGDRLVASSIPGVAMKADPSTVNAAVLGRAVEPLEAGSGLIRVLVGVR